MIDGVLHKVIGRFFRKNNIWIAFRGAVLNLYKDRW